MLRPVRVCVLCLDKYMLTPTFVATEGAKALVRQGSRITGQQEDEWGGNGTCEAYLHKCTFLTDVRFRHFFPGDETYCIC